MVLDFSEQGRLKVDMTDYATTILSDLPDDMRGASKYPAGRNLFTIREQTPKLNEDTANTAPLETMQFGKCLIRILQRIHRANPRYGPVYLSKIDISDGLLGDLGHILKSSQCGARIDQTKLPVLPWIEQQSLYDIALGAGDDYEICCTVQLALFGKPIMCG